MKRKKELNTLKEKAETLNEKFAELTDEELTHVNGGTDWNRFARYILTNGGGDDPELNEMVANIMAGNMKLVEISALLLREKNDLVSKAWKASQ